MPREIIVALNLPWTGIDRGTLGDGSEVTFEVYATTVIWDGEYRDIPINEADIDPSDGSTLPLFYGEVKMDVDNQYHPVPRTRPSEE